MKRDDLRELLAGNDRRSTGRADELAEMLLRHETLFAPTVRLMLDEDPVVRMRSADAAEKASRARQSLLAPHKEALLGDIAAVEQQEVKWHLLQMLPRLDLADGERARAFGIAQAALAHQSRIVQAEALSSLFALAGADPMLAKRACSLAEAATRSSAPAVRARARKLLELR